MAIITRPIKTGGGTDYIAGNDELAQEFNDDANTIYDDYNGNVTNANCAANMGLEGTKLADAPNGIPSAKINDLAVTTAKISNDTIPTVKFKTYLIEDVTFSFTGVTNYLTTGISVAFRVVTGSVTKLDIINVLADFGGNITYQIQNSTLVTALPVATKDIISAHVFFTTGYLGFSGAIAGYVRVISMAKS